MLSLRTIEGPNVYHSRPVLIMKVDLQDWVDRPTKSFPIFNERLLESLDGLRQHHCSPGHAGGFVERLEGGTYLAHVIEHIALEMSELAGIGVDFGKSRFCGQQSQYEIVTRFLNEEGMRLCLVNAYTLADSLVHLRPFDLANALTQIRAQIEATQLGPTTEALLNAARSRGIPCRHFGSSRLEMGYGQNRRVVQAAVSDRTSLIAADLVQDKDLTKKFLQEHFVPVPEGLVVREKPEVEGVWERLKPPYVVKPLDGHHGRGVCLNLDTLEELQRAFEIARSFGPEVLVEEMCLGHDYRILVIGGKFVAAAERRPPLVVGDGEKTIRHLIDLLNADPRRAGGHAGVLTKVEMDDSLMGTLQKQGHSLESIPSAGSIVQLRANANLSGGGTAIDVTPEIHPNVRKLCERIARLVNLDICGIDLIHRNIAEPVNDFCKVIEVNAAPGFRMHLSPSEGQPRDVAGAVIDMLYPPGTSSRIPIVGVTGTNGKTTVVRLIRRILSLGATKCVGMTTTDGIWVGENQILSGDTTGPQSSRTILSDPEVEAAVLEIARGGLLRGGLAYDWSDVGVITNIRPDHIGQDGIEDLEDLVWIKSLVAERVRDGGTLILNADDPESFALVQSDGVKRRDLRIVLYSTRAEGANLTEHLAAGHEVYVCDQGWLCRRTGAWNQKIISLSEVPFSMHGKATFQVSNALAATAAAFSMGAPIEHVLEGLRTFNPSLENKGRANLYQVGQGYLLLDYGHNPDAIEAVGATLAHWEGYHKTAVFGLPGDRADDLLANSAVRVSSYFDRIVLRDDLDLRNRKSGEVPALIKKQIREARPEISCEVILNEIEAVENALSSLQKNQITVIFYDEFEPVMKIIHEFHPKPVNMIPILQAKDSDYRIAR